MSEFHECLGCGKLISQEQLWVHDKKHYDEVLQEFKVPPYNDPLVEDLNWSLE